MFEHPNPPPLDTLLADGHAHACKKGVRAHGRARVYIRALCGRTSFGGNRDQLATRAAEAGAVFFFFFLSFSPACRCLWLAVTSGGQGGRAPLLRVGARL